MQKISHSLILLKGEPKTKQIESIIRMDNGAYRVRFKKNIQGYYYNKKLCAFMFIKAFVTGRKCIKLILVELEKYKKSDIIIKKRKSLLKNKKNRHWDVGGNYRSADI